jgi:hypothetical protein
MSYENTCRDAMKEDVARQHWEDHVLCHDAMHVQHRQDEAYGHWCATRSDEPTMAQLTSARQDLEEKQFQEWYDLKKRKGFAQFGDPWACDEEDSE